MQAEDLDVARRHLAEGFQPSSCAEQVGCDWLAEQIAQIGSLLSDFLLDVIEKPGFAYD